MAEIRNQTFTADTTVETDGNRYVECSFEGATLQYAGGEHPSFENCRSTDVSWYFAGAALRTIQLLQDVATSEPGRKMVTDLFRPGNFIGE